MKEKQTQNYYGCLLGLTIFLIFNMAEPGFSSEKLDSLIERFNHHGTTIFEKSIIIEEIGKLKDDSSFRFLTKHLDHESLSIRISSIKALGRLGDKKAIAYLRSKWNLLRITNFDTNEESDKIYEKAFIASSLFQLGEIEPVEFLYSALGSSIKEVRFNVVHALGEVANTRAVDRLIELLFSDNEMVVSAVAEQLIRIKGLRENPRTAIIIKARSSWFLKQLPQ